MELASCAKALVLPSQYEPLQEFIRMNRFKFSSKHVFLDASLEPVIADIVDDINGDLKKKEKFYQKKSMAPAAAKS
jgi:hypothetical protein